MAKSESVAVKASGSGLSFWSLLAVVFITLKLCGVITWPWLWVLAPLWLPVAVVLSILFGVLLFCGFCAGMAAIANKV